MKSKASGALKREWCVFVCACVCTVVMRGKRVSGERENAGGAGRRRATARAARLFFLPSPLVSSSPAHAPLKTVTASDPPLGHSQLSTQAAPRKGGMRWADGRERERVREKKRAGEARLVFSSEVEEKKKGAAGPPAYEKSSTCVIYNPKNSERGRKRSVRRCPSGLRGLTRRSYILLARVG